MNNEELLEFIIKKFIFPKYPILVDIDYIVKEDFEWGGGRYYVKFKTSKCISYSEQDNIINTIRDVFYAASIDKSENQFDKETYGIMVFFKCENDEL